ncbi:hypothetical protein BH11PSE12_BH11PSE12_07000 [soil metagenome]
MEQLPPKPTPPSLSLSQQMTEPACAPAPGLNPSALHSPYSDCFLRLSRTARRLFQLPFAAVYWREPELSVPEPDAPDAHWRQHLLAEVVRTDTNLIVPDSLHYPHFPGRPPDNHASARCYAALPLHAAHGRVSAWICLIDYVPRQFTQDDLLSLQDLVALAESEIALIDAAQTVKDSDSRLFNILENITDAIVTVDDTDQITSVNPAALALFGYQESEMLGSNIKTLMTTTYHSLREGFIQNYRRVAKSSSADTLHDYRMTGRHKNGRQFAIGLTLSDMRVVVKRQACYMLIIRAVSELKEVEKQLREGSALLKTVMDSTTSYVHVRDLQGRYLYVNKEYETVFRCRNEDIKGVSYADILPLELAQNVWQSERGVIESGSTTQTENIIEREDGPHTYMVIRSPLFDDSGAVTGTCGVGIDITQHKRMEYEMEQALASLRVSEERWAFALEGSGDGVWDWDLQSNTVQLSRRWKEMLGHTEDEIGEQLSEWSSRVHPDDMPDVMRDVQANLAGTTRSFSNEHRVLCKDGSYLWVLDRGMVVRRDALGAPLRMVGTHTDISQRKQMERIKAEFISTVSHELRTPVTSIRGALGLLEAGVVGELPPKAMGLIKVAHNNSKRLITLVNDILDMEKLLSGQMRMEVGPVNLHDLLTQAIEANNAYAANYQVSYRLLPAPPPSVVNGDPDRLMQILNNLLSNAAKFSRSGGIVTLQIVREQNSLKVEVKDRGEGIPLAFQPRIFDAFAQADSADTRQQGGTGLGLNISKKLIQQMGGEIGYITSVGQGTTFWFSLPAVD